MEGDDAPLDELKREVQELARQILVLQDEQWKLNGRLNSLNQMIEDRQQH